MMKRAIKSFSILLSHTHWDRMNDFLSLLPPTIQNAILRLRWPEIPSIRSNDAIDITGAAGSHEIGMNIVDFHIVKIEYGR